MSVAVRERKVITPTIQTLLERKARKREELFLRIPLSLVERVAPLGPDAVLLFAILYSVHVMQPKAGYFLLQAEFEAAIGRGRRWWHWYAKKLEDAGFIEVKRAVGAKPRYRILDKAV